MNRYFVTVLICSACVGCLPKIQHVPFDPEVQGILRSGEKALAGVTLYYDFNPLAGISECRKTVIVDNTDSNGRFSFKNKTEFGVLWVYGDKIFRPRICAEIDGKLEVIWSKFRVGYIEGEFELECNLSRKDVEEYESDVKCSEVEVQATESRLHLDGAPYQTTLSAASYA